MIKSLICFFAHIALRLCCLYAENNVLLYLMTYNIDKYTYIYSQSFVVFPEAPRETNIPTVSLFMDKEEVINGHGRNGVSKHRPYLVADCPYRHLGNESGANFIKDKTIAKAAGSFCNRMMNYLFDKSAKPYSTRFILLFISSSHDSFSI